MNGVHNPPDWLSARDRLVVQEAYCRLLVAMRALRASRAAERLITYVFEDVHGLHLYRKRPSRAQLAKVSGLKSVRQVSRILTWAWRNDFVFQGFGSSGRQLGQLLLRPQWLVRDREFWSDRQAPVDLTRTQMSLSSSAHTGPPSPKEVPGSYSADGAGTASKEARRTNDNGERPTDPDLPPPMSASAELVARFLREHERRAGRAPPPS